MGPLASKRASWLMNTLRCWEGGSPDVAWKLHALYLALVHFFQLAVPEVYPL